jgi:hypothetical protein
MINKETANQILSTLDRTANKLEAAVKAGILDSRLAMSLVHEIDSYADRFQIAAFGEGSFRRHQTMMKQARVIKRDSDEQYMDTFNNPNKVIQSDQDEPYMHQTPSSFNAKAIDNYDQDRTTTVSDRDEYAVRDLSDLSEPTKKQPSWSRGPAGKSTRQGATQPQPRSKKQWA